MSSRIEHPLGGGTGRTPRAERRSSYTADEAIAAKAEIDALVANGLGSRAAAAMKGHITRKTVGYLPRRRRLIQRMIRKGSREYLDWMFESDETLAEAFIFAGAEITRLMATSGMTLDEICEQIGLDVDTADMVMATVNAPPLVAMELPRESVLLPISKIVGAADWLHESEIELLAIRPEDHDGAEYRRFDFGSEEDAMLFRLRFL